jgi:hypothetical protein
LNHPPTKLPLQPYARKPASLLDRDALTIKASTRKNSPEMGGSGKVEGDRRQETPTESRASRGLPSGHEKAGENSPAWKVVSYKGDSNHRSLHSRIFLAISANGSFRKIAAGTAFIFCVRNEREADVFSGGLGK